MRGRQVRDVRRWIWTVEGGAVARGRKRNDDHQRLSRRDHRRPCRPSGTYGLFLEIQPTGPWTWILSTQTEWGAYQYESKYDVVRVPATPAPAPYTEFLIKNIPENQKVNLPVYEQALKALKEKS
jgi:hypothetical protein